MADFADNQNERATEESAADLRQQMQDLRRETRHQLDRMAEQMRGYRTNMARETKSHIRDRPLTSVGGAFALGMAVGCLVAFLSHSNQR